jgi:RNA polymerase primary sigma factor
LNATALLSAEEERELAEHVSHGDPAARDRLIRANLRLVVHLARSYLRRGLPLEDLIAEGNLGLMRAVEGFDAAAGARFGTYASFWIKQSIRAAVIKQGKPIRLPQYLVTLLTKWGRVAAALSERLGRPPAPEEVAEALGISGGRRAAAVHALDLTAMCTVADESEDGDDSPLARVVDERGKAAEDHLLEAEDLERAFAALGRLGDRQAAVLRQRFGLDSACPMTLSEIARGMGLTRERVRQIEKEALFQLVDECV